VWVGGSPPESKLNGADVPDSEGSALRIIEVELIRMRMCRKGEVTCEGVIAKKGAIERVVL
jgi:hypothetical protein